MDELIDDADLDITEEEFLKKSIEEQNKIITKNINILNYIGESPYEKIYLFQEFSLIYFNIDIDSFAFFSSTRNVAF